MEDMNRYISKWWGNMVGDTDDSLCLIDYFELKKCNRISLSTILHELMLDKYLREATLQESKDMHFVINFPDGQCMEANFDISIDPVIDLCALLVEQIHSGTISTIELDPSSKHPVVFSIEIEKEHLKLLIDELTHFSQNPLSYDLAEMVPEDDMLELAGMCREIVEELNAYDDTL